MPSLTVRDIPEELMERLRRAAAEERRSVNSQALYWLEWAARHWMSLEERTGLVERIRASREATFRRHGMGGDSAKLIRKIRDASTKGLLRRAGR